MLRCPTCGRRYAADARFCPADGTALVADDAPPAGRPSAIRPDARALPASRALDDLLAQADAAHDTARPVAPPPAGPPYTARDTPPGEASDDPAAGDVYDPTGAAAPRRSRRWIVLLTVVGLGRGAATAAYVLRGARSLEQEAYDALARGDLVTPARVSAYDFALRLADRYPSSGAAERVGAEALPRLVAAMDAFYAQFYRTSEATTADWGRMARLAAWATAIAPQDAHVRARADYAAARVAALAGDTDAARDAYERAAEAWPEWALPPNSLGLLLAQSRDTDGAIARYREAAALDPAWPFPLSNLGALYLRLDRFDAAASALEGAVEADPARPYTHALLARAYAGQTRYDEASAEAAEALRLDPGGEAGFDANRLRRDIQQWDLLAQGVEDWDGDGVVEPDDGMEGDSASYESDELYNGD